MTKRLYSIVGITVVAGMAAAVLVVSSAQAGHRGEPQCISGFCNNASGSYTTAGASFTGQVTVSQQLPSFGLWCASLTGWWLSPNFGGTPQSQTYNSDPSTCNDVTTNPTRSFSFSGIDGGTNFYEGSAIAWEWIGGPSPWRPYFLNTPTFQPNPQPPAPTVTLCCSNNNVTAGTSVTLRMTVSGTATSCNASGYWAGAVSTTGGSVTITPTVPGTYSESVQCSNGAGPGNTASVSITVNSPPPPAPQNLRITPAGTQRHGDIATSQWDAVAGATSYNLYVVPSGGATSVCAAGCPLAQSAFCTGGTCAISGPNHAPQPDGSFGYSAGTFSVSVTACNATCGSAMSPVSVTVQSNIAAFVSQRVKNQNNPTTLTVQPGSTFRAELTFTNTGTATWDSTSAGEYVLRAKNPDGNTLWGGAEVPITPTTTNPAVSAVPPGGQVTFAGDVVAPNQSGATYNFQWQMYRKTNTFGYFGGLSAPISITTTGQTQAQPIKVKLQIKARQHLPLQ